MEDDGYRESKLGMLVPSAPAPLASVGDSIAALNPETGGIYEGLVATVQPPTVDICCDSGDFRTFLAGENILTTVSHLLTTGSPEIFEVHATEAKTRGNDLFRMKQTAGAQTWYRRALAILRDGPASAFVSVGSAVQYRSGPKFKGPFKEATIATLDEASGKADLIGAADVDNVPLQHIRRLGGMELEEVNKLFAACQLNLVRCLLGQKKFQEARLILQELAELVPDRAAVYLLRGKCLTELHKFSAAQRNFEFVLTRLDPANKEAQRGLANIVKKRARVKKENKKMAKDMCEWIEKATEKAEELASSATGE